MRKSSVMFVSLLVLMSMLLAACQPAAPVAPAAPAAPEQVEVTKVVEKQVEVTKVVQEQVMITATPSPEKVQIYWYIGLGAGSQPAQIPLEKAFVDKYNASQNEIQLIPIIVDNKYARDNLTAQVAAGNAPDIVGPVGTAGRMAFPGAFLDLEPMVKEFNYDTSDIDPAFLDFYKDEGKLVGLPFAIFPEFTYVNKDLFKEAGLNLPPQKYGEQYVMPDGTKKDWDFDTLAEISKILTVDANGVAANEPGFDATKIVQYGYVPQWTDHMRAIGSLFGAWEMVDPATGNAVLPESAREAIKWYYDGMWGKQPFIPNSAAMASDLMKGNAFSSGKVAMGTSHLWYTCCVDAATVPNWDTAVMPAYKGKVTSKMHGDTFAIMAGSKHPKEAFKVYSYMLGEGATELYALYGGLPARKGQQQAFFDELSKKFAPNVVNWQPAIDSVQYMDVPNHEHVVTAAFSKFWDVGSALTSKVQTDGKITDFDALFTDYEAQMTAVLKDAAK